MPELTQLQGELLTSAVSALKPGGIVAYVTCSPHLAETVGVVADVRREWGAALEELDARAVITGVADADPDLPAAVGRIRQGAAVAAPSQHRRDVDHAAAAPLTRLYRSIRKPSGSPSNSVSSATSAPGWRRSTSRASSVTMAPVRQIRRELAQHREDAFGAGEAQLAVEPDHRARSRRRGR